MLAQIENEKLKIEESLGPVAGLFNFQFSIFNSPSPGVRR
jgi:hypothetical protein